ncbi:MAG: ribose 5-phosphate isomerase B [Desulfovibrio sp.]|jgi:ribose 5-phosphate isomerase B|nr:ribose 5-phosphate isomerase B [Desulfovibrio sp.]
MDTPALFIASDHAGFSLKQDLLAHLREKSRNIQDLGPASDLSADYPDYARTLCARILAANAFGILICGTGIGMSIAANRHQGIRAALCLHEFQAEAARRHNDAKILCLAARLTAPPLARALVDVFLAAPFEGGRHQRRIALIDQV